MKMRHLQLPSGIVEGIPFLIANHWTPEQAMAVVELLDDLREQIWRHYELQLVPLIREDRRQQSMDIAASDSSRDDNDLF